jgi:MinD-like ATPase involved in chromosome partitioning or flagellar assembly
LAEQPRTGFPLAPQALPTVGDRPAPGFPGMAARPQGTGENPRAAGENAPPLPPANAPRSPRWRPPSTSGRTSAGDTRWERLRFEISDALTSGGLSERLVRASSAVEAPITTGRRIVVVGVTGGVGTTTVAALSAKLLGSIRQEPVMAIDAIDESGRLLHYAGADKDALWSAAALALRSQPVRTLPDVVGSAASCGSQVFALGRSDVPAATDTLIGATEWTDLSAIFSRFVAVTVVDAGASPRSGQTTALMETAHAVIVVAPDTEFGTARAAAVRAALSESHTGIAVVTVLTSINRPNGRAGYTDGLPFDRHLAAGGPIRLSHLGARTRIAATEIAGSALSAANGR